MNEPEPRTRPSGRLRRVLVPTVLLIGAVVCVRLGFWQISRLHEKQRLNAQQRSALAAPSRRIDHTIVPYEAIRDRRVELHGWYDESHQVLLTGRVEAGSPGVHVVTPLRLGNGRVVLVDRGWLYAADAATALPQRYPEPGLQTVVGLAMPLQSGGHFPMWRVPIDSIQVWATRALDPDSLAARLPYPVAAWYVRQLPGPGVPAQPLRAAPKPYDEFMHISYAVQWFLFATIFLVGPLVVMRSRRRRVGREDDADPELYRS